VSEYRLINLCDLLLNDSEEGVNKILSRFSCPTNKDIEIFLKEKAVAFSKASIARTYLVYADSGRQADLVGFFALAPKSLLIKSVSELSNTLAKKISRFSDYYEEYKAQIISVVLIAQLGKNFTNANDKLISGEQLLKLAFDTIKDIQKGLGGKTVCAEAEDSPALLNFYINNGFIRLQNRDVKEGLVNKANYLVQLVKQI
jgi:hypothetical protein